MNAEQLSRVGEKLVKRCGSRDPFEIARQLGINVMLYLRQTPYRQIHLHLPWLLLSYRTRLKHC